MTVPGPSFGIPRPARRKPEVRSRVGNGKVLLPMTDGRSLTARRFQDLLEDVANDLGGLAMWRSEDSSNPDTEVFNAIRASIATFGNEGLIISASSP